MTHSTNFNHAPFSKNKNKSNADPLVTPTPKYQVQTLKRFLAHKNTPTFLTHRVKKLPIQKPYTQHSARDT